MHLAFDRLFETGQVGLRRKRLKKDNTYGLPAGDYLIHDLFPVRSDHGSDIYFTVERIKSGEILTTARLDTETQILRLSPQHLQSAEVGEALELLTQVLNEAETMSKLEARALQMMELYAQQTEQAAAKAQQRLSQETIVHLAAQLDGVIMAHPTQWESALDAFLAELKQNFLAGLQTQHLSQQIEQTEPHTES